MDNTYSKKIVIRYTPDVVDKPLVCHLAQIYDLSFNILRARVSQRREGLLVLEPFLHRGKAGVVDHPFLADHPGDSRPARPEDDVAVSGAEDADHGCNGVS